MLFFLLSCLLSLRQEVQWNWHALAEVVHQHALFAAYLTSLSRASRIVSGLIVRTKSSACLGAIPKSRSSRRACTDTNNGRVCTQVVVSAGRCRIQPSILSILVISAIGRRPSLQATCRPGGQDQFRDQSSSAETLLTASRNPNASAFFTLFDILRSLFGLRNMPYRVFRPISCKVRNASRSTRGSCVPL